MAMFNRTQQSAAPADRAAPRQGDANAGFLPQEFVEQRRVRRSTAFSLALFLVVLLFIAGAFFVTNRQWNDVRDYGRAVDIRYHQAAENLVQLNELEAHANTLTRKAEVVLALVERVPRSLLIAEITSAMPAQMTLTEFELSSVKVKPPAPDEDEKKKKKSSTRKSRTSDEGPEQTDEVYVPRFKSSIVLMGVAPTHQDIARYVSALQNSELLEGVELKVSESTTIKDRTMIKFRIEGMIDAAADPRQRAARAEQRVASVDELMEGDTK